MYHVQLHFFTRALAFPQTLSLWQRSPAAPAVALPVSITNAAQKGKEKRTPFAAWSVVSAQWIVLGQCQLRVGDWMEQQQTDLGGDSKSRGVFFCCFVFVSPSLAGSVAYFYGYTGLIMCIKYCHICVCVCFYICCTIHRLCRGMKWQNTYINCSTFTQSESESESELRVSHRRRRVKRKKAQRSRQSQTGL